MHARSDRARGASAVSRPRYEGVLLAVESVQPLVVLKTQHRMPFLPLVDPLLELELLQYRCGWPADGSLERGYGGLRQAVPGVPGTSCLHSRPVTPMPEPENNSPTSCYDHSETNVLHGHCPSVAPDLAYNEKAPRPDVRPQATAPRGAAGRDVQCPFDPCRDPGPDPGPGRADTPRYHPVPDWSLPACRRSRPLASASFMFSRSGFSRKSTLIVSCKLLLFNS